MRRVAFIGLGNMGAPMARNLLRAGYHLQVFDVVEAAAESFRSLGAMVAAYAVEAARDADAVITMVPSGRHVKAVYLGEGGVLAAVRPGTLIIDSSTIAASDARDVARAAAERNLDMIDAPVSGGTAGAAAASALRTVSRRRRCRTSWPRARGVTGHWRATTPGPGVMDGVPASRAYSGGFSSDLMLKDLGLAQEAAITSRSATPLGALARQLYQLHSQAGNDKLDFSSVMKLINSS